MEVKRGLLFDGSLRTKLCEKTRCFIQDYTLQRLREFQMTEETVKISDKPQDGIHRYWMWKKEPCNQIEDNARSLVIVTESQSDQLDFPGIWSESAYTDCDEKHGTMFPYIEKAISGKSVDYDKVILFHVNQRKPDGERQFDKVMLYLIRNELKNMYEVDAILVGHCGKLCYQFMTKCTYFPKYLLGSIIMLDAPCNIENLFANMNCEYEKMEILREIKQRTTNITPSATISDSQQIFVHRNSCNKLFNHLIIDTTRQELGPVVLDFCFSLLEVNVVEKKIFHLRIFLNTVLFLTVMLLLLLLNNFKQ